MSAKQSGSRWPVIVSAVLVACMVGFGLQGCSGPVAKVNQAGNKVEQAEGRADTRVEDAGDKAGNKASEIERKVNKAERILN